MYGVFCLNPNPTLTQSLTLILNPNPIPDRYATQAFRALREDASLVLNLLWLMGRAGIADLSVAQEPTQAIRAVHDRLRLDLSDSDADKYIRSRIARGFKAVLPSVLDTVHRIAVSLST